MPGAGGRSSGAFDLHLTQDKRKCTIEKNKKDMITVQSQAKFHKSDEKCEAFWRLALNSYRI